ncbi:hypothetical protein JB92DRAFT_2824511 [Gautieria morchelliformis]|nr:hypothetical protein JB92DRAFT_2824511 [Gautieria morchelliformis]
MLELVPSSHNCPQLVVFGWSNWSERVREESEEPALGSGDAVELPEGARVVLRRSRKTADILEITSACIKATRIATDIIKSSSERESLAAELQALHTVLKDAVGLADQQSSQSEPGGASRLETLNSLIKQCREEMENFLPRLHGKVGDVEAGAESTLEAALGCTIEGTTSSLKQKGPFQALKWPLKASDVKSFINTIRHIKGLLEVAMVTDATIQKGVESLKEEVKALKMLQETQSPDADRTTRRLMQTMIGDLRELHNKAEEIRLQTARQSRFGFRAPSVLQDSAPCDAKQCDLPGYQCGALTYKAPTGKINGPDQMISCRARRMIRSLEQMMRLSAKIDKIGYALSESSLSGCTELIWTRVDGLGTNGSPVIGSDSWRSVPWLLRAARAAHAVVAAVVSPIPVSSTGLLEQG